ncbi:sensor histidine kinase [Nocardioides sp.]|uniref:sensor histidine kinase n=1 Tax=Nocardioides sp. TaxID=35761 RepID=UPI002733A2A0|nr:histidine kinase [Nocardioides sp.]MDP3891867.1 histidine kinase [Nocardioides sp.]
MVGSLPRGVRRQLARIEERGATRDLAYPWWIALGAAGGQVACVLLAVAQRGANIGPGLATIALLLVALPHVLHLSIDRWVPWWATSASVLAGVALLLTVPVGSISPIDAAPAVLFVLVAEVTVTDGPRVGLGVLALSAALILTAGWGEPGVEVHVLEVLVGAAVGYMLRWQMRALAAERVARAGERERATLAERQRIARDIHDLVGHSLSVTLLHVTGARRALALAEEGDADVADALEALTDAERIGREAMADIRRTVGVLADGPAGVRPPPGAIDIAGLVEDVRAAGLDVDHSCSGDPSTLPPSVGLGVYRVAQESLANIAKHAATGPAAGAATVHLEVTADRGRLQVSNPLPDCPQRAGTPGSGLQGLAWRADQLGGSVEAGPVGDAWVVDLVVPVDGSEVDPCSDATGLACRVRRALW